MSSRDMTRYSGQRGAMPLSEAMGQLFRDAFTSPFWDGGYRTVGHAVNLYEKDNSYILQVPLPGIKQDQLNVTARENVVTLQGTLEFPVPDGARALYQGSGGGQFWEQIALPSDIDAENASAQYQEGILTLTLPKAQHARERAIPIGAGAGQSRLGTDAGQRQAQGQSQANKETASARS